MTSPENFYWSKSDIIPEYKEMPEGSKVPSATFRPTELIILLFGVLLLPCLSMLRCMQNDVGVNEHRER